MARNTYNVRWAGSKFFGAGSPVLEGSEDVPGSALRFHGETPIDYTTDKQRLTNALRGGLSSQYNDLIRAPGAEFRGPTSSGPTGPTYERAKFLGQMYSLRNPALRNAPETKDLQNLYNETLGQAQEDEHIYG